MKLLVKSWLNQSYLFVIFYPILIRCIGVRFNVINVSVKKKSFCWTLNNETFGEETMTKSGVFRVFIADTDTDTDAMWSMYRPQSDH
jgi:hypothetical protein